MEVLKPVTASEVDTGLESLTLLVHFHGIARPTEHTSLPHRGRRCTEQIERPPCMTRLATARPKTQISPIQKLAWMQGRRSKKRTPRRCPTDVGYVDLDGVPRFERKVHA